MLRVEVKYFRGITHRKLEGIIKDATGVKDELYKTHYIGFDLAPNSGGNVKGTFVPECFYNVEGGEEDDATLFGDEDDSLEVSKEPEMVCEICNQPSVWMGSLAMCPVCFLKQDVAKANRNGKMAPEAILEMFTRSYPEISEELARLEGVMGCRECLFTGEYKDGCRAAPYGTDKEVSECCALLRQLVGTKLIEPYVSSSTGG